MGLRWRWLIGLSLAYAAFMALLHWLTVDRAIALYGGDFWRAPTGWLLLVWFCSYLVPVLLALGFGAVFRPFRRNALALFGLLLGKSQAVLQFRCLLLQAGDDLRLFIHLCGQIGDFLRHFTSTFI